MRWLFLRLFVFVILAALPVVWAMEVLLKYPEEEEIKAYELMMTGGCTLAVERLERAPTAQRESIREELEGIFGYPIRLLPGNAEISQTARDRFAVGAVVAEFWDDENREYVVARFRDGSAYVEFGPFLAPREVTLTDRLRAYGPISLILAAGMWLLIWPVALQHKRLEKAAIEIARCQWGSRIETRFLPDVKNVALAFNRMAEKTERVVNSQRMLLRSVAHELRTPLARLRFGLEALEDCDDRVDRSAQVDKLDGDLEQLAHLIDDLLGYSKLEDDDATIETEQVLLSDLLEAIAHAEQDAAASAARVELGQGIELLTEPLGLHRQTLSLVLANLVRNGLAHARSLVRVDAALHGGQLVVRVEDDGPGIPVADHARVFEPFVRLEGARGAGSGLGLAIVRRIVERNGGNVRIDHSALGGCLFELVWIVDGR